MDLLNDIIVLCLLGIILFQDFRERKISAFLLPLLLTGFIIRAILKGQSDVLIINTSLNFIFILIQLLILTLYYSLKNKKIVNIIDSHLGLGDVLLFVILCTVFSPVNFILFYLASLVFSLILFLICRILKKNTNSEIPLAGTVSLALMLLLLTGYFIPMDLQNNPVILF